jgi:phosphatidylinositol-3,4,5-trisphosphate 3-phosphatase/dual-specificity protein phosphatase PTEN
MAVVLRRLVSKKKKRFQDPENNFDLDLTYVTNRIVAMGFPSENFERFYRNPMTEVQRFLETRHKDKYKLWNLCAEREYNKACFHGRVVDDYQFYDHEAPKMEIIIPFCKSVHEWLTADPENVAFIHCKAGKGRTGVMICCYMLYSQFKANATESMQFYAIARTLNQKGVTIPSQQRYIRYCDRVLHLPENKKDTLSPNDTYVLPHPENDTLTMTSVRLVPAPNGSGTLNLVVYDSDRNVLYDQFEKTQHLQSYDDSSKEVEFKLSLKVSQDVKVSIQKKKGGKMKPVINFWFNTTFIDDNFLAIPKLEMDKAYKDAKKHKHYKENFQAEVYFGDGK